MNNAIKILISLVVILIIMNIAILLYIFPQSQLPPVPSLGGPAGPPPTGRPVIGPDDLMRRRMAGKRRGMAPGRPMMPANFANDNSMLMQCRRSLYYIAQPYINKVTNYDRLIYEELIKPSPDKKLINSYLDSLAIAQKRLKQSAIEYFLANEDSLTPAQKEFLLQTMLRKHLGTPPIN